LIYFKKKGAPVKELQGVIGGRIKTMFYSVSRVGKSKVMKKKEMREDMARVK